MKQAIEFLFCQQFMVVLGIGARRQILQNKRKLQNIHKYYLLLTLQPKDLSYHNRHKALLVTLNKVKE